MVIDIDELTDIAKHLVKDVKVRHKTQLINDIVLYLAEVMVKYKHKIFTKKHLIQLGRNYLKPIEPFRIGKRIRLNPE